MEEEKSKMRKDFSDNYKKPRGEATHDAHMQPSGLRILCCFYHTLFRDM